MTKRLSLQDVAKLAGVSRATASLVVRDSPLVAEGTRRKVLQVIAASGYKYNRIAASFRSQKTGMLALILPTIANPFFAEMIEGIERVVQPKGYTLQIHLSYEDLQRQRDILHKIEEYRVDGIFICPAQGSNDALLLQLAELKLPYVFVARHLDTRNSNYVGIDNVQGSRLAVQHLTQQKGCKNIAYIGGPLASAARKERLEGYKQGLATAGLPWRQELIAPSEIHIRGGFTAFEQLASAHELDAVLCYNDIVALGVSLAARHLRQQVAVIGFDNISQAQYWIPSLTTVYVDAQEIGAQAMRLLSRQLEQPGVAAKQLLLEPKLCLRESLPSDLVGYGESIAVGVPL